MMIDGFDPPVPARQRSLTVSGLLRLMQTVLEDEVGRVRVEGEIADFNQATSGHCYFSLKDGKSRVACVLFAGTWRTQRLTALPADGMQVEVEGDAAIYPARGQLQLIVRRIVPGGQGALLLRFEALKRQLQAEGLFDTASKRPLPALPRRIGIVTSPTGAAIRDMLKVLRERFANLAVLIAPVRVQGEAAATEIARAIEQLNARGGLDVLIVGRGGGSLEDLWPFNEAIVARAVRASRIPVISAVGHEVDVTLSDLAADLRAPTPSAAAEMVIGRKSDFLDHLGRAERALRLALDGRLREIRMRWSALRESRLRREPRYVLAQSRQALDALTAKAADVLRTRHERERRRLTDAAGRLQRPRGLFDLDARQERIAAISMRLQHALKGSSGSARQSLEALERQLHALGPEQVLARGYSLVLDSTGGLVQSTAVLQPGDALRLRLKDGSADVKVESVARSADCGAET